MGVNVVIRVDPSPVLAILRSLSSPDFERTAALAINDTLKNAQVQTTKELAPAMGAKSRDVKAALSIERAAPDGLTGALVAKGRPIKLISFRPRTTGKGVAVRIGGHVETFGRAFLATGPRTGVEAVFQRKGKERGPIYELYGPSVPGFLARHDQLPALARALDVRLVVNLQRQLTRRMYANASKPIKL
jgi:hypothetical protein